MKKIDSMLGEQQNTRGVVVDEDVLLERFEDAFARMREDLRFSASLDDLDCIFFVRDYVLGRGYVGRHLSRAICGRIVDLYMGWYNQLHRWVMPHPASVQDVSESQQFSDKEKELIFVVMSEMLALLTRNPIVGITKNRREEALFIDDAVAFWDTHKGEFVCWLRKVNTYWKTGAGNAALEQKTAL